MSDYQFLRNVSNDTLAALVFELASQLHVERAQRIALQQALIDQGVLTAEALSLGRAEAQAALDMSMEKLLRIVLEAGEPATPLRAEAMKGAR
jgi:hypothetical protein